MLQTAVPADSAETKLRIAPCCSELPTGNLENMYTDLDDPEKVQKPMSSEDAGSSKLATILHHSLDMSPIFRYSCSFMLLLLPLPSGAAHEPPDTELMASTYLAKRTEGN